MRPRQRFDPTSTGGQGCACDTCMALCGDLGCGRAQCDVCSLVTLVKLRYCCDWQPSTQGAQTERGSEAMVRKRSTREASKAVSAGSRSVSVWIQPVKKRDDREANTYTAAEKVAHPARNLLVTRS